MADTKIRNVGKRVGKGNPHSRLAECRLRSTAALSGGLSRTEMELLHGQLWSRDS